MVVFAVVIVFLSRAVQVFVAAFCVKEKNEFGILKLPPMTAHLLGLFDHFYYYSFYYCKYPG
jgi:hypothetical protein